MSADGLGGDACQRTGKSSTLPPSSNSPTASCNAASKQNLMGLEALGADESVAQLASSVILHLEKHSRVRVEQHETLALVGLLNVLAKNLAQRATR